MDKVLDMIGVAGALTVVMSGATFWWVSRQEVEGVDE